MLKSIFLCWNSLLSNCSYLGLILILRSLCHISGYHLRLFSRLIDADLNISGVTLIISAHELLLLIALALILLVLLISQGSSEQRRVARLSDRLLLQLRGACLFMLNPLQLISFHII
jgi:ABC-type Na+ efflux pump permease subunit